MWSFAEDLDSYEHAMMEFVNMTVGSVSTSHGLVRFATDRYQGLGEDALDNVRAI